MIIKKLHSPNFSKKKRKKSDIKHIIIHYTGMQSKIESIKRLSNPKHKVSCHFLIDRQGLITKMVNEDKIAWHAGKSRWKKYKNLNESSIGIELVNRGHEFGYEKFTNIQIKNLIKLCLNMKKKYRINNQNILGHSDISPLRKQDPGEKFPWKKLKQNRVGIWFQNSKLKKIKFDKKKIETLFFKNLFKIGYRYFSTTKRVKKDFFIIKAFQRRFVQNQLSGKIDKKTYIISHFLANSLKN